MPNNTKQKKPILCHQVSVLIPLAMKIEDVMTNLSGAGTAIMGQEG